MKFSDIDIGQKFQIKGKSEVWTKRYYETAIVDGYECSDYIYKNTIVKLYVDQKADDNSITFSNRSTPPGQRFS